MMKKVIVVVLLALASMAFANMPAPLGYHMSHLAGLAGFVEVPCDELGSEIPEPMKCFYTGVPPQLAMQGIDLYVDWEERMRPWATAMPLGSWSLDSSYPGGAFSRFFLTQGSHGYGAFAFENFVIMVFVQ